MVDAKGGSESPAPSGDEVMAAVLSEMREDAPEGQDAPAGIADSPDASAPEEESSDAPPTAEEGGEEQGDDTTEEDGSDEPGDDEGVADDEPDPDGIEPPQHWPDEHKEIFNGLDPEGQAFIMERHREIEADNTRKSMEIADLKRPLVPIQNDIAARGMNFSQFIGRMVALDVNLRANPEEAVRNLAKANGVDLTAGEEDDDDFDMSPREKRMLEKIGELTDTIRKTGVSNGQAPAPANNAAISAEIEAFKSDKDDKGNLTHPHFAEVEGDMTLLAQAMIMEGKKPALQELYDKAVRANEKTWEKVVASKKPAVSSEAERKEKVRRARKAKAGAKGSSATPAPPTRRKGITLEEDLKETWKELQAKQTA